MTEEPDPGSALVAELGALQFRRDFLRSVDVSEVNAVGRMATKKEVALDTDQINHLAKQFFEGYIALHFKKPMRMHTVLEEFYIDTLNISEI